MTKSIGDSTSAQVASQTEQIDERKGALRAKMRALRNSLSADKRSSMDGRIRERVCSLAAYENADTVFTYLSFGAEVDTRGIIEQAWRDGKRVALPRCTGPREMRWFLVTSFDDLEMSSFGVEEPRENVEQEVIPSDCENAIALVPGLTFDDEGYRLGYGGGFYDTFLADFSGSSFGLCRSEQRNGDLVSLGVIDAHDKAVDIVISD